MKYEPVGPDDFCKHPTPNNHYCRYPAARCPLHESRFNTGPQPPEPPERWIIPGPDDRPLKMTNRGPYESSDPGGTIRQVIDALNSGDASPLQVQRLTRALHTIEKLKKDTVSEEEALAECALRGFLMNGIAPFDKPMWDLAEQIFDDEGLALLIMSAKRWRHAFPAALDERPKSGS